MRLNPSAPLALAWLAVAVLANGPVLAADPMSSRPNASSTHVGFGALASLQPEQREGSPYLDESLGGVEPGLMVTLQHRTPRAWLLALELSSTRRMEALQRGRFVSTPPCGSFPGSGCGPARARHRDTLLSALVGIALPLGGVSLEPKAGVSAVFGQPERGVEELDVNGHIGLTVGADGVIPLGRRVALALSLRHSRVSRDDDALYVGLGNKITRAGLLVRVSLP